MLNDTSVKILPESDDTTLCVSLSGVVKIDSYTKNFKNPLLDIIKKHKKFKILLVVTPEFLGWDEDAAQASLNNRIAIKDDAEKIAIVTYDEDNKMKQLQFRGLFASSQFETFDDRYEDAVKWIKE